MVFGLETIHLDIQSNLRIIIMPIYGTFLKGLEPVASRKHCLQCAENDQHEGISVHLLYDIWFVVNDTYIIK